MTVNQENAQAFSGSDLLTPQEQAICKQITTREAPHSQRAQALLVLNERSTQAQAAEQASLSTGQVRYWLAKFRKLRLGIFPETLLGELVTKAEAELITEIVPKPESVTEKVDSTEGKPKRKKAKKGKMPKKQPTKVKKAKKSKKTKKSDKNTKKAKKIKKAKKSTKAKKGKKTKKPKK